MQDPFVQLRKYLDQLTINFFYVKTVHAHIETFLEWRKKGEQQVFKQAEDFYSLVYYVFRRELEIEVYKMLSDREDRSLIHWLCHAITNAEHIEAAEYDAFAKRDEARKKLTKEQYREITLRHIDLINEKKDLVKNLTALRDKGLHADKKYFFNPEQLDEDFPVCWSDMASLIECIETILKDHAYYLEGVDLGMPSNDTSGIETLLRMSRAVNRLKSIEEFSQRHGQVPNSV